MTVRDAIVSVAPLLIAAALAFGPIGAWLANRRARNPAVWLVLAAITGPIGLALLLAAPPGRCSTCGEPTSGFGATCQICGGPTRHVRARPATASFDVAAHASAAGAAPDPDLVAVPWVPPVASATEPDEGLPVAVGPGRRKASKAGTAPKSERAASTPAQRTTRATRSTRSRGGAADAEGLKAVGARRPSAAEEAAQPSAAPATPINRSGAPVMAPVGATSTTGAAPTIPGTGTPLRAGLSILAIAVFVQGSENLLPGSRYLLARTATHLVVVGPLEASTQHTELNLPLERVEANTLMDRLVVSGWESGRGRRWVLGFQSLNGLTATAVDEALTADPERVRALATS